MGPGERGQAAEEMQERQHDLERLNKLSTAAAAARKHALECKRSKEEEKKRLEAEELAVKVEDRLHVKKVLKEEERRRRRESGALRATTMRERAEATTAVIEEQEERERGLLESRRQDAQQVKAYKEKERRPATVHGHAWHCGSAREAGGSSGTAIEG